MLALQPYRQAFEAYRWRYWRSIVLRALDVAQLGMALRDLEHDALVLPSLTGMGMLDTGDRVGMA